jgi:hypothetical protein
MRRIEPSPTIRVKQIEELGRIVALPLCKPIKARDVLCQEKFPLKLRHR